MWAYFLHVPEVRSVSYLTIIYGGSVQDHNRSRDMAWCRLITDAFNEISALIIQAKDVLNTLTIRQNLPMFRSLRFLYSGSKISLILKMKPASSNAT